MDNHPRIRLARDQDFFASIGHDGFPEPDGHEVGRLGDGQSYLSPTAL
jgi:hypothetical protein